MFYLLYVLPMLLSYQEAEIVYKTTSLWNRDYFKPPQILLTGLDLVNGEDINSEPYGGINYRILKEASSYVEIPTVSLNYLEIGVDLINNTNSECVVDHIELIKVADQDLGSIPGITGRWGSILNPTHFIGTIHIVLGNFEDKIVYYPEGLFISKNEGLKDSRILLGIEAGESSGVEERMISFKVHIALTPVASGSKQIDVYSDKLYHMVIQ